RRAPAADRRDTLGARDLCSPLAGAAGPRGARAGRAEGRRGSRAGARTRGAGRGRGAGPGRARPRRRPFDRGGVVEDHATPLTHPDLESEIERFSSTFGAVCDEVGRVLLGQEDLVRGVLVALVAGGHVLLEG